jgi:prevent-host-death family protein
MDGTVGAYEAKTHLSALLDRVERGETVTITRKGRPVARLVPAVEPALAPTPPAEASRLVERFRALREELRAGGVRPFTPEEIVDLVRSGRKY